MKKFLSIIILTLCFIIPSLANDIEDFEIEGIPIFSNLLDQAEKLGVTKEFILKREIAFYPNSKRIGMLRFKNR